MTSLRPFRTTSTFSGVLNHSFKINLVAENSAAKSMFAKTFGKDRKSFYMNRDVENLLEVYLKMNTPNVCTQKARFPVLNLDLNKLMMLTCVS